MNKKLLTKIILPAIVALLSTGLLVASPAPVHAAPDLAGGLEVYKKALLNGINTCYRPSNHTNDYFYYVEKTVEDKDFRYSTWSTNITTRSGRNDRYVAVPNNIMGMDDIALAGSISCQTVFNELERIYSSGRPKPEDIGYSKGNTNGDERNCVSIKHRKGTVVAESEIFYETDQYCFDVSDGKFNYDVVDNVEVTSPQNRSSNINFSPASDGSQDMIITITDDMANEGATYRVSVKGGGEWNAFVSALKEHAAKFGELTDSNGTRYILNAEVVEATNKENTYERNARSASEGPSSSALTAIRFYAGDENMLWASTLLTYTEQNKFDLGMLYINDYLEDPDFPEFRVDESKCAEDSKKGTISGETGYLYHRGENDWCVLRGVDSLKDQTVNMIVGDGKHTMTKKTMEYVIKQMQRNVYNKLSPGSSTSTLDDVEGTTPNCWNAASSLGWFLCPAIQVLGNLTTSIYDSVIKSSFLSIDGETMLSTSGNLSLYRSWEVFRDYANIIFVILLTVVLLSQFTGKGIDNYGIKKILPRLIVMVMLVNVSFVICQLAVDLSNILGHGLQNLFEDFARNVTIVTKDGSNIDAHLGSFLGTLLGTSEGALFGNIINGGGAILGGIIIARTWESWIIPFALFLLGCVIGVLFFMIILGVREAGIIILVAMTPVAIICYALPNTKKLFDKWFKLFISLLMVFPIAGALMGGGYWASKLMLATAVNGGGFFYALVAMLLQVVPFFFIPTLVKSSLAAAGAIGAKIAGMGDRLRSGATRAIKNSDGYKDTQERLAGYNGQRRLNRLRTRIERDGNPEYRAAHPIRGLLRRPGEAFRKTTIGQNGVNRRLNRANTAVLTASLNNRDRSDAFEQRQINEFANDYTSSYDKQGMLDDEIAMGDEAIAALNELHQDPNSLQAKGRFLAVAQQLAKSGPERNKMQAVLDTHAYNNHGEVDADGNAQIGDGLRWANSAWKKEIAQKKDNALGVFNRAHEMSQGSVNMNDFKEELDKDGNPTGMWINHSHDNDVAGDIGANQVGKMDKPELRNLLSALENGTLRQENARSLLNAVHEANNNPNISIDGDKQDLVDQIARFSYMNPEVGGNDTVSSVDSTTMNIMARSSQAELTRMANYASSGKTKGQELKQLANVAEATLRNANLGKVNLDAEKAEQLNRILTADRRKAIPYSLHVDHNNPAPPPPSGYHDTGTGSGIIVPN